MVITQRNLQWWNDDNDDDDEEEEKKDDDDSVIAIHFGRSKATCLPTLPFAPCRPSRCRDNIQESSNSLRIVRVSAINHWSLIWLCINKRRFTCVGPMQCSWDEVNIFYLYKYWFNKFLFYGPIKEIVKMHSFWLWPWRYLFALSLGRRPTCLVLYGIQQ